MPQTREDCRGDKKPATYERRGKALIDVEQLLGAHAPAEIKSAAAGKEQCLDGGIVPYVCGYCIRTFLDVNILDRHQRLCKPLAFKQRSTDEDIGSNFLCLVCSKGFRTDLSLRSHKRHCKGPGDNKLGSGSAVVPSMFAALATPAASDDPMAEEICSSCFKMCKGTCGLVAHCRIGQVQAAATSCFSGAGAAGDVVCALDSEAPASVHPLVFDMEHAPDGHNDMEIPCTQRLNIIRNDRAMRTPHRSSKRLAVDVLAPTDPLADQVCQICSKVCKGIRGLRSHRRACSDQTVAVEAAGPNVGGAVAPGYAAVSLVEHKRRRRSKTKDQPMVSVSHDLQLGDGPAPNQVAVDKCVLPPPFSSWQQNR